MNDNEEALWWYKMVSQHLRISLMDIQDGRFPREDHMDVIHALWPVYCNGCIEFPKQPKQLIVESVEQRTLFSDNMTPITTDNMTEEHNNTSGTGIDININDVKL